MVMEIDANRAAYVLQAYRYVIVSDPTVGTNKTVVLETNLDAAAAQALATKAADDLKKQIVVEVDVEGVFDLDAFVGAPPQFTLNLPRRNIVGVTGKAVRMVANDETNVTTLTVVA